MTTSGDEGVRAADVVVVVGMRRSQQILWYDR